MLRFVFVYDARFADALSLDPLQKFEPIQRSVDPYAPFKKSNRFSGPWIPTPPLKIRTDLAVHGSLDFL